MQTLFQLPKPISKNLLNPMLTFGIGEPGTKCKDCRYLCHFHQSATWFKCDLSPEGTGGRATDHKANFQACSKFQSIDPSCPNCGAKQLADCSCPLKNGTYEN